MSLKGWDLGWKKNLSSRDQIKINPKHFVMLEIKKGHNKSSRALATQFDDISKGFFYYRDWTSSGMPWLDENEIYWSGFWFEHLGDAKIFVTLYGGSGYWMKKHQEFVDNANKNR